MSISAVFMSLEGRLPRKPYWIASVALLVLLSVLFAGVGLSDPGAVLRRPPDQWYRVFSFFVVLASAWPIYALIVKRLHDLDQAEWPAQVYVALTLAFYLLDALGWGETAEGYTIPAYVVGIPMLLLTVALTVYTGFFRGTAAPNRYGPDPLAG